MVQIETQQAVDNVEEITAVDGIDGIFVGPSDLSASLGHFGNPKHPEVQAAIKHVFEVAKAQGKACGILAPIEADAHHYIEMGATFVAVGNDLGLLRSSTQALADKFLK
jgi:2,4-dihydroxyhept-2-ene-1,7-dioic acid aldolase